jgi:hypothetical protein
LLITYSDPDLDLESAFFRQVIGIRPASSSGQGPATPHMQPVLAPLVPATPTLPVDLAAMANRQELCQSVQLLRASSALRLQSVHVQGMQFLCDVSRGAPRPVVPLQDRQGVFQVLHGLAHPGIRATRRRRGGCVPPLAPFYVGPYEVRSKHAKTFTLKVGDKSEVVSVDRLKPHTGTTPVVPAAPPARGRPAARSRVRPATS